MDTTNETLNQFVCSECGRPFPSEELVELLGKYSCAACKPIALQRIKEGEAPASSIGVESKLFSPKQIGIAAFLGAPFCGCWFLAHNYKQLGKSHQSAIALALGFIGTLFLITIAFFLRADAPNRLLPIIYAYGLYLFARHYQGPQFRAHVAANGRLGSWWAVVGISLLCGLASLIVAFGAALILPL